MKNLLIIFGGNSPEHEVSVITGLQAIKNIDRSKYNIHPIYISKNMEFYYVPVEKLNSLLTSKLKSISFGFDKKGGYLKVTKFLSNKVYIHSTLLCTHGGYGESGNLQGLLDYYKIPHTSSGVESSSLCMNKYLSKVICEKFEIKTVKYINYSTENIFNLKESDLTEISNSLGSEVILKPVHLGSSIGIQIAKNISELRLKLIELAYLDSNVLIEEYLKDIYEYNISVFKYKNEIILSEIEKPLNKEEILSYADKYMNGNKLKYSGMASLNRELPARIDKELKSQMEENAKIIYKALGCKGVVRIDFIYDKLSKTLYFNEINPIPGSLSFYLWEAKGISYMELINMMIEQSIFDAEKNNLKQIDYKSDILERYFSNTNR